MGKLLKKNKIGFTLIELLIVIAIIAIIAGAVLVAINPAKRLAQANDSQRISSMESFKTGLDLYATDHQGSYACIGTCGITEQGGSNFWAYNYKWPGADGICGTGDEDVITSGEIRFSNSASGGMFMEELASAGYIGKGDWNDPTNPSISDKNNCRYIVKESENVAGKIEHYALHCNLEYYLDHESNDGGTNDTVYEIQKPNNWLCIYGIYD